MPKVSFVIPVYNAQEHLRAALNSTLWQTFRDYDIIAVDNNSTDNSRAILDAYAARHPRLRVVTETVQGVATAANRGFAEASCAAYVARMDADDICHPLRLQRQVAFMDAHPEVTAACGVGNLVHRPWRRASWIPTEPEGVRAMLLFKNSISNPSMIFRAADVQTHALQYGRTVISEDYDLWLRMTEEHKLKLACVPQLVLWYRSLYAGRIGVRLRTEQAQSSAVCREWILRRFMPDITAEAVTFHLHMMQGRLPRDAAHMRKAEQWLHTLLAYNASTGFYVQHWLELHAARTWFNLCVKAAKHAPAYRLFMDSSLTRVMPDKLFRGWRLLLKGLSS